MFIAMLAGCFQDLIFPGVDKFRKPDLPFARDSNARIEYLSWEDTLLDLFDAKFGDQDEKPIEAGVRHGLDYYFLYGVSADDAPALVVGRPQGREPSYVVGDEVNGATYEKLFEGYEAAIVFSEHVGSGGFLYTLGALQWLPQEGRYALITNWVFQEESRASFAFVDLDEDGWKELVVSSKEEVQFFCL